MSASAERDISVRRGDYSVMGRDFGNMKDRFETEMRRMEAEMNRLKNEFEVSTAPPFRPAIGDRPEGYHYDSSSYYSSEKTSGQQHSPVAYSQQLDRVKSPLIREESDGKKLMLRFDVHEYRPEEIKVKTVDNRLKVSAKHEEKTEQRTVFKEFNREFTLPRGTDPTKITSTLSTDGVLTVESPLPIAQKPAITQQ